MAKTKSNVLAYALKSDDGEKPRSNIQSVQLPITVQQRKNQGPDPVENENRLPQGNSPQEFRFTANSKIQS